MLRVKCEGTPRGDAEPTGQRVNGPAERRAEYLANGVWRVIAPALSGPRPSQAHGSVCMPAYAEPRNWNWAEGTLHAGHIEQPLEQLRLPMAHIRGPVLANSLWARMPLRMSRGCLGQMTLHRLGGQARLKRSE